MKKLIPIFALCLVCFYSCKKESKLPESPMNKPIPSLPNSNQFTTNVIGGAHYICPKRCKGGTSEAKGTCATCNSALAHNQGFHNTPTNSQFNTPVSTPISTPKTTPASGPNLAGQYHYTCSNGCTGVGDAAGKCNKCSKELVHNAAFHQ